MNHSNQFPNVNSYRIGTGHNVQIDTNALLRNSIYNKNLSQKAYHYHLHKSIQFYIIHHPLKTQTLLLDRRYCFYIYSFDIGMRLKSTEKLQFLYWTDDEKEHRNDSDDEGHNTMAMVIFMVKKIINWFVCHRYVLNVMGKNNIEKNRYCTNNIDINVRFEGGVYELIVLLETYETYILVHFYLFICFL